MTIEHRDPATQRGFTQLANNFIFDSRFTPQARLLYGMLKAYAWQKDNAFPGRSG